MEEKKQFDLFARLFPLMRQIERFCENYCRSHGVPCHSQARVLVFLAMEGSHKDIFQRDVEFNFQIRPSSATALLQSLENQGLIRREQTASDGRYKRIVLTEKAAPLKEEISRIHGTLHKILLAGLTPENIQEFEHFCDTIEGNIASFES